jgi:membrane-associated phospholipid phosphatase
MTSTSHDTPRAPWRPPWLTRFARLHPKAYLGLHVLAGAVAPIGLTWLFLAIADEIPERSTLVEVDKVIARWLEAHGTEPGETILYAVSAFGAPVLVALVVAAILYFAWRRDWRTAIALALTSGGGVLLSNVLKMVFHRGRPDTAVEFITRPTWSFPSGHALNSVVSYGFLTMLLLHRIADRRKQVAVVLAAIIVVVAVGFSRLYLGVHYLSDVTGGWLAGAAWLLVCVSAYRFTPGKWSSDAHG